MLCILGLFSLATTWNVLFSAAYVPSRTTLQHNSFVRNDERRHYHPSFTLKHNGNFLPSTSLEAFGKKDIDDDFATITKTYDATRQVYEEWCETFGKVKDDEEKYEIFRENYEHIEGCTKQPMKGIALSRYADCTWDEYVTAMIGTGDNVCKILSDMTVKDLKEECRKRRIFVGGKKAELVKRLQAALRLMREDGVTQEEKEVEEEANGAALGLKEQEHMSIAYRAMAEVQALEDALDERLIAEDRGNKDMEKAEAQKQAQELEQLANEINEFLVENLNSQTAAEGSGQEKEEAFDSQKEGIGSDAVNLQKKATTVQTLAEESEEDTVAEADQKNNEINKVVSENNPDGVGGVLSKRSETSLLEDIVDLAGILLKTMWEKAKDSGDPPSELTKIVAPPLIGQMTYYATSNMEATSKFYEGALNFTTTSTLQYNNNTNSRVYQVASGAHVGFYNLGNNNDEDTSASVSSSPQEPILILFTHDLDGWAKRLESEGIAAEKNVSGEKVLFRDPNGYQIEIQRSD